MPYQDVEPASNLKYNCILRVLVVDANPIRRQALVENLRQRSYDVCYAEGEGVALLEDAQEKARDHLCHVVVVVPRLINPADPADLSGLDLAAHLLPARAVIYAPEADDSLAYESGRRNMTYIRQDRPIADLLDAVESQGRLGCNCKLKVYWPEDNFHLQVTEALKEQAGQITPDQLYDLLGQLFPEAIALHLGTLPSLETRSLNEPIEVQVPVRRAVVLWARERRPHTNTMLTPKVIKIGSRNDIQQEVNNYRHYVDGRLSQERQARLENHRIHWRLGAITYAFLGASPQHLLLFRLFYDRSDAEGVIDVLHQLFTDTARSWYQEQRIFKQTSLFTLYDRPLKIKKRLERLDANTDPLIFPGISESLPNPALWVKRHGVNAVSSELTMCISHGDLHADNFFVDQGRLPWLIDFGQTGPAHVFRDFVELESDIKLRLVAYPPNADLPALAALERALLATRSLSGLYAPTPEVIANPAVYKAFQVIAALRHLATIVTGVTDYQEYLHALLYETLFMATLSRFSPAIHERARLSAALIVESMQRRTGLLGRQAAIRRLDVAALLQKSPAQVAAEVEAHRGYLRACFQSAMLQRDRYNGAAPADLELGMTQIREEALRLPSLAQNR